MNDDRQSLGGRARAEKLSPERRREIASQAAESRWADAKELPKALFGSADRPLRIGDLEIPCYVLEDDRRVIVQRGMMTALDMKQGTAGRGPGDRLVRFAATKSVSPFISDDLRRVITNPIKFRIGGSVAYGYEAVVLADLCDAVLRAREEGKLNYQQDHIAAQCEILVRGFSRVGIIALVDEATGYQEERDRDALHRLLEIYLSKERLAWAKRFPDEFYKQLYRLKQWRWPTGRARTPLVGKLTNKLVYDRLPDGVLTELRNRNPTEPGTGRRRWKHHQFLSEDIGQPDLRDHLLQLVAVMRASPDWRTFERNFEAAFPKPGTQIELVLERSES